MRKLAVLASSLVLAAAACGGGKVTPEQPYDVHSHGVGEKHDLEEEHHGVGVAEIDGFHDTLAPLWHAPAGAQRKTDTCAAVPKMKDQAMQAVGRGRADHAQWEGNANALVNAVAALGDACDGKGDFDATFAAVHDAYHGLMEGAMGGAETGKDHADVGH